MNKGIKRFLSLLIAVMMVIQPFTSVYAAEIKDESGQPVAGSPGDAEPEDSEPEDIKSDETTIYEIDASEMQYRLLVASDDPNTLTDGYIISEYDGVYLIGYTTEEDRISGYDYYQKCADFVEYDDDIYEIADDTEGLDNVPEEDKNEIVINADDALTNLSDMQESDISEMSDVIAVIDTGDNGKASDAVSVIGDQTSDDNGHGSMVIDTILEINPDAKILSIKAFDENGKAKPSDIYAAVRYAMDNGVNIINLSFSSFSSADNTIVKDLINEANDCGITVIGAAGNKGKNAKYYIPGNIESAIIAGSVDEKGYKKDFSNYGDTVDYYVVSDSTSKASAKLTGFISKNGMNFRNEEVFVPDRVIFEKNEEKVDIKDDSKEEISEELRRGTFDVQAYDGSGDGQAYLTYIGDRYVTWSDDVYSSSFGVPTREFFIIDGSTWTGQRWNAYCVDPSLTKPDKGMYKTYEVGVYIGKVMYYMYGAPGWDTPLSCLGNISLHQYVNSQGYSSEGGYVTVCHYLLATLAETQKLGGTGYSDSPTWVQGLATTLVQNAPNSPKGFHCYFAFSYEKNHSWQNVWGWEMSPPPYMVTLEKSSTVGTDSRSLDGIQYGLYNAENKLVATYTLGANGKTKAIDIYKGAGSIAGAEDSVVTENGTLWLEWWSSAASQNWYFKELKTNTNYGVKATGSIASGNWTSDVTRYSVTVKQDEKTTVKASDTPVYGKIEVFKYSNGDKTKPLAGAEFTVYSDSNCTRVVGKMAHNDGNGRHEYTSSKGFATLTGLVPGTYYVRETKAPDGYEKNNTTYTVHVNVPSGQVSWGDTYMGYVFDPVYYYKNTLTANDRSTLGLTSTADNLSAEDINTMFRHFIRSGLTNEVASRIGTPSFRADQYLANRPDLVTVWAGMSSSNKANYNNSMNVYAAVHYATNGAKEGSMGRNAAYYQGLNEGVNNDNQISVAILVSDKEQHVYATLKKSSSNPSCSDNNPNYSLAGAEYKLFESNADASAAKASKDYSKAIGTFTVKADGTSNVIDVTDYMGVKTDGSLRNTTFYALETKSGKNYAIDSTVHEVLVKSDNNTTAKAAVLSVTDTPINDPIDITVVKQFKDGHTEPLANAKFTVKYYAEDISKNYTFEQLQSKTAIESDTYKTNINGRTSIRIEHGTYPLGYITIEETKAPTGFKLDDSTVTIDGRQASTKMAFVLVSSGNTTTGYSAAGAVLIKDDGTRDASASLKINVTNQIIYSDEEIRADFTIYKENGATGQRVEGIKYEIVNVDTNEKYEFVTDKNGYFSSVASYKSHSAEGGIWFKKGVQNTSQDTPDDTMGALPYGTYKVTEIDSKGLQKEEPYTFNVRQNGTVYRVFDRDKTSKSQVNSNMPLPTLKTYAVVVMNENGQTAESKIVPASAGQTINDVCTYTDLRCDTDYTLMGTLMQVDKKGNATVFKDGNGNDAVVIKSFKTKATYDKSINEASGKETVTFSNLDFTDIQDTSFVVYERLYIGKLTLDDIKNDNFDTSYVGSNNDTVKFPLIHESLTDKDQTVSTPSIGTEAASIDTTKTVTSINEITLVDTVEFKGLKPGNTYQLSGKLYYQPEDLNKTYTDAEIEAMAVKDKNGNYVTATEPFTPDKPDGITTVTFKFDVAGLKKEAVSYVVFETLYDESGKIKFCTHASITDQGQTVHEPRIGTTAKGTEGRKELLYTQGSFIDSVSYTNVEPETTYKLVGIAMDKKTGEKLVLNGKNVTAEKEFTSAKANLKNGMAEGIWDLEFKLTEDQYEDLRGKDIVIFEALFNQKGTLIATHNDINDIGQELVVPDIHTTLTDKKTGDHIAYTGEETVLVDQVKYSNLIEDGSYVINGKLMLKSTNKPLLNKDGKEIKASMPFIAAKGGSGTVDITFKFDASALDIKGETIVAFEECIPFNGKIPVGVHTDINDVEQSVVFPSGHTDADDARTQIGMGNAAPEAVIYDYCFYEGLLINKEYTCVGKLMNKATNKPFLDQNGNEITSTVKFTAETENGHIVVPFKFDASLLKGEEVVCFETIYYKDKEVFIHADIYDEKQTVKYPLVSTTATLKNNKTYKAGETVTVYDEVKCDNIIAGETYRVKGCLMDKSTGKLFTVNGKVFTSEKEFVAKDTSETINVEYTFDSKNVGNFDVVVFEELYVVRDINGEKTEVLVGSEKDISCKNQTVSIYTVPKTGDYIPIILIVGVCIISIIGIILIVRNKKNLHIV